MLDGAIFCIKLLRHRPSPIAVVTLFTLQWDECPLRVRCIGIR